jgi:hypothetical protein
MGAAAAPNKKKNVTVIYMAKLASIKGHERKV